MAQLQGPHIFGPEYGPKPWENEADAISEFYDENIPTVVMLAIFSVTGVIGNSMVLYVYNKLNKLSTTKRIIFIIAVYDLVTALLVVPFLIISKMYWFSIVDAKFCKYLFGTNDFGITPGPVLLLLVTFVRFCHHVGHDDVLHSIGQKLKKLVGFTVLIGISYGVFNVIFVELVPYRGHDEDIELVTKTHLVVCKLDSMKLWVQNYVLSKMIMVTLISAALIVLNVVIFVRYSRHKATMTQLVEKKQSQIATDTLHSEKQNQGTNDTLKTANENQNQNASDCKNHKNGKQKTPGCSNVDEHQNQNKNASDWLNGVNSNHTQNARDCLNQVNDNRNQNADKSEITKSQNSEITKSQKSEITKSQKSESTKGGPELGSHSTKGGGPGTTGSRSIVSKWSGRWSKWSKRSRRTTRNTAENSTENREHSEKETSSNKHDLSSSSSGGEQEEGKHSDKVRDHSPKQFSRTTVMISLVCLAYIICYLPLLVIVYYGKRELYKSTTHELRKFVWEPLSNLYYLGCAVNPVIYFLVNPFFKTKLCAKPKKVKFEKQPHIEDFQA